MMRLYKFSLLLFAIVFCQSVSGQRAVTIPDSIKYNINKEIDFIKDRLDNFKGDVYALVKLKCHLISLYNKAGKYQEADTLIAAFSPNEFKVAKGEISLMQAIKFKYDLQPEKSKFLFDKALLQFVIDKDYCMQIETRIELMEYYRKFELPELGVQEADEVKKLLRANKDCGKLYEIKYLNRLAALQNIYNGKLSIQTSYQCVDTCLKYKEDYYLAVSYNEIGYSFQHLEKFDSADYFYQLSESIFSRKGLLADVLHVKMNRMRMYAHNRLSVEKIIPGLIEIEETALASVPNYNLLECYRSIWVECQFQENFETGFWYFRKFYYLDISRLQNDVSKQVEIVKQQEKESKTKIQNFLLSTRVEQQKNELNQTKTIIWFVVVALIILISIMVFLFRVLKQRNKLTEDLRERNLQKDQLIQEVHHRVKNNLSFVSSLLEMQINSLPEETKTGELRNASMRIESMSLVHQMLYSQEDIATVDLKIYLPELITYLQDSLLSDNRVEIKLICDTIQIESRGATAIGLIVTEFITNSFKHAFKGMAYPRIDLFFNIRDKKLICILKDNGVGLSNNRSGSKIGFGMRIIDIFSRQINAEIEFSYQQGMQLKMVMPYEK